MSEPHSGNDKVKSSANMRVFAVCAAFVVSMVGVSYAAVPLYQLFCQVTGYGGTTQRVEQASDVILDRKIKVHFDSNVAGGLPWDFKPVECKLPIPPKTNRTIRLTVRRRSTSHRCPQVPISTRSSVSVSPRMN